MNSVLERVRIGPIDVDTGSDLQDVIFALLIAVALIAVIAAIKRWIR